MSAYVLAGCHVLDWSTIGRYHPNLPNHCTEQIKGTRRAGLGLYRKFSPCFRQTEIGQAAGCTRTRSIPPKPGLKLGTYRHHLRTSIDLSSWRDLICRESTLIKLLKSGHVKDRMSRMTPRVALMLHVRWLSCAVHIYGGLCSHVRSQYLRPFNQVESGSPYALGVQNSKRASVSSPPLQALNYDGRCSTLHSLRRGRFKVVLPLTEKRERSSLQMTFNLDGPQSNVEVQADLTVCHMFSGQHPQLYRLVPLDPI